MLTIPINRVVTFLGPPINVVCAGAAAWLVARLNLLGIPGLGLDANGVASEIAGGVTALLTAGLLQLGQLKWLKGHHIILKAAAENGAPVDDEPGDVAGVDAVA